MHSWQLGNFVDACMRLFVCVKVNPCFYGNCTTLISQLFQQPRCNSSHVRTWSLDRREENTLTYSQICVCYESVPFQWMPGSVWAVTWIDLNLPITHTHTLMSNLYLIYERCTVFLSDCSFLAWRDYRIYPNVKRAHILCAVLKFTSVRLNLSLVHLHVNTVPIYLPIYLFTSLIIYVWLTLGFGAIRLKVTVKAFTLFQTNNKQTNCCCF